MNIQSVCILGGTGFVGWHLVNRLAEHKLRITVLSRTPARHRTLRVLPTVRLVQADVHTQDTLIRHFAGQDAVINLIGILNERGHDGQGFVHAHVTLAQKIMQALQSQGVARYLHMSALGAAPGAPSHYLRTKGEAEALVHGFTPAIAVTSVRPSVIFGPGDSFLNRFAGLLRISPVLPLACPNARCAPVYVGDIVDAFASALNNAETFGRRLDLCGPKEYTLKALVEYVAQMTQKRRLVVGLPDALARLQAKILEHVPGKPFSEDNYRSLTQDSVCPPDTARCPTALETVAPYYLGARYRPDYPGRFRLHGQLPEAPRTPLDQDQS